MWNVQTTENNDVATFEVNGSVTEVEAGADLKETVLGFARDAGYGKFRFYVDGDETLPQDAPELVVAKTAYKIVPYDTAG